MDFDSIVQSGRPWIVAEIGINHNGDLELAKESIKKAAECGADSVKFQNYSADDFLSDSQLQFEYFSAGEVIRESQYEMFKRCELNIDQLKSLKELCDDIGVLFHSTPTSIVGLKQLSSFGTKLVKNGSDYLTNVPLIRAMGESGMSTILSTGMATLSEIEHAVLAFFETGNNNLMLLHCTSAYPTPVGEVNLARIETLRQTFGVPVGFSDHTSGVTAAIGATILGACWIEKHFTLDRSLPGPDHWFSMDPEELKTLVKGVKDASIMIGSGVISPTKSELKSRFEFRLSCVAARDMKVGEKVKQNDIELKRPGGGIAPIHFDILVGLEIKKPIKRGDQFFDHF